MKPGGLLHDLLPRVWNKLKLFYSLKRCLLVLLDIVDNGKKTTVSVNSMIQHVAYFTPLVSESPPLRTYEHQEMHEPATQLSSRFSCSRVAPTVCSRWRRRRRVRLRRRRLRKASAMAPGGLPDISGMPLGQEWPRPSCQRFMLRDKSGSTGTETFETMYHELPRHCLICLMFDFQTLDFQNFVWHFVALIPFHICSTIPCLKTRRNSQPSEDLSQGARVGRSSSTNLEDGF